MHSIKFINMSVDIRILLYIQSNTILTYNSLKIHYFMKNLIIRLISIMVCLDKHYKGSLSFINLKLNTLWQNMLFVLDIQMSLSSTLCKWWYKWELFVSVKYPCLKMFLLEERSVSMWKRDSHLRGEIVRNPSVSLSPTLSRNEKVE